jgi:phosphonate metabolism protein (transferase hexapeptide repeat family)
MMPRLSEHKPLIHSTADVNHSTLDRFVEIEARSRVGETELGDYSYVMQDCAIWCARIGKFANIAASVRINATNHPTWRATLHHFTYRAGDYFEGAADEEEFFEWRRSQQVTIGHDVWIGHGATILPGVNIGNGAVVGAGAVVSRDVAPYTIVGGIPARLIRRRFTPDIGQRMDRLAWWEWQHDKLFSVLNDFRTLTAEAFVERYEAVTPNLHGTDIKPSPSSYSG